MTKKINRKRKPLISALEPRILFDGAAITTAVDVLDNTSFESTNDANETTVKTMDVPVIPQASDRKEIAFVDTSVEDYQTLVDGIDDSIDIYEISSVDEIEDILKNLEDIDAIHILSHGNTGEITIGEDVINQDTLNQFEEVTTLLKESLTNEGDILLYGCNVASNGEGQDFIDEFANITQADIAASDDITGSSDLGGDWDLEVESGDVETDEIVVDAFDGELAAIEYADLSDWSLASGSGTWVLMEGNRTIFQIINTTGIFVSSETYIDTLLKTTIYQTDSTYTINGSNYVTNYSGDYDDIGYVIGYEDDKNYVLIQWRGQDSGSSAGLYLVKYTDGQATTLDSLVGSNEKWLKNTLFQFEILYTTDTVKVNVNGENVLGYTGTANYFDEGSLGFWMRSQGGVEYGNVQITDASSTQLPPVANTDQYGVSPDSSLTVNSFDGLFSNDYDVNLDEYNLVVNGVELDGDSSTTKPSSTTFTTTHGEVTVNYDGSFTYTPTSGYQGADSFDYKLVQRDNFSIESLTASVNFGVFSNNHTPTDITLSNNIVGASATVNSVVGTFTTTDEDVYDVHDYLLLSDNSNKFKIVDGVLKIASEGITTGTYSITVRTVDLYGAYRDETFSITVAANSAPTSANTSVTVNEATPYSFASDDFTFTDTEDSFGGLKVTTLPSDGTLKLNGVAITAGSVITDISNLSYTPDGLSPDSFNFQVLDDRGALSASTYTTSISVLDLPPTLNIGTLNAYNPNSGTISIAPNLTLTDPGNSDINQAKIVIDNYKSGDTLSFSSINGISGSWDSSSSTLTLTGTATTSEYEAALKTVKFNTSSTDAEDRTFSFTVGSAIPFEVEGENHFYEVIDVTSDSRASAYSSGITWTQAKEFAETLSLYGMEGYLATITSAEENAFILDKLNTDAWIGGSDADSEGTWKWVTGPESGTIFSTGNTPSVVEVTYENWNTGEPNDSGYNEDAAEFYGSNNGLWNDLPATGSTLNYLIVEYGGMPGDADPVISGTSTMAVEVAPIAVNDSKSGNEDSLLSGNLLTNDSDADGDSLSVTKAQPSVGSIVTVGTNSTVNGSYGVLTISDDGSYSYDPNDYSALGENPTDTFTITISDGSYTDTQTLTFNITGVNDAPALSTDGIEGPDFPVDFTFNEDGEAIIQTGHLGAFDFDTTDTSSASITLKSATGEKSTLTDSDLLSMISLNSTNIISNNLRFGGVNWSFNSGSEYFDYLDVNESLELVYTITLTDDSGASNNNDTQDITITINGVNDAPTLTAESESGNENAAFTGNVLDNDSDIDGDSISVTGIADGDTPIVVGTNTLIQGTYGVLTISSNGSYSYAPSNHLAVSENYQESFTYIVSDGDATSFSTLTFNITGINDAPVISVDSGDSISESLTESDTTLQVNGTLSVEDLDLSDTVDVSITNISSTGNTNGMTDETLLAMMSTAFEQVINSSSTEGSITWEFDSSGEAFNHLSDGEVLELTYTLTVTDGQNSTDTQSVTISITGTNDTPVFGNDTSLGTNVLVFSKLDMNGDDSNPSNRTENANLASIVQYFINDEDSGYTSYNENGTYSNSYTDYDFNAFNVDSSLTTFSDPELESKLASASFLFMPDMESGFNISTDLPDSAKTILSNWVNDGGVLMMTGTAGSLDAQFLNEIFGWDTSSVSYNSSLATLNSENAAGTPFEGGPSSLTGPSATDMLNGGTVENFNPIYGTQESALVATISEGSGTIIYLGFDFYNTGISGTGYVIESGNENFVNDVSTGSAASNDWVQQIVPRALQYSALLSSSTTMSETDSTLSTSGTLPISDIDKLDTVTTSYTVSAIQKDSDDIVMSSDSSQPNNSTLLGMLKITAAPIDNSSTNGSIAWDFNSDGFDGASLAENFGYLSEGETLELTYTITASDDSSTSASDSTDVVITIKGTNDNPIISIEEGDSNSETLAETDSTVSVSGSLTVTDLDTTNTVSVDTYSVTASGDTSGLTATNTELLSMLKLDETTIITDSSTVGKITGSFDSNGFDGANLGETFDYLAAGETLTLTYTGRVTDSSGGIGEGIVTINITGTNDAPTITSHTDGILTETIDASDQDLSSSGTVAFNDIDYSDTIDITYTSNSDITWNKADSSTADLTMVDSTLASKLVDGFSVSGTDVSAPGSVNWSYNVTGADLDFLAVGESITFSYDVTIDDDNGGTDTETVTITINGLNDTPTISHPATVTVIEDVPFTFENANLISFGDLDNTDVITTATVSVSNGTGTLTVDETTGATVSSGTNGTKTVQISGTVEEVNAALDGMLYTPTANEWGDDYSTLSISVTDGKATTTSSLVIDVTTVNDDPVAGNMTATVNPGSKQTFDKFVPIFSDIDNFDNHPEVQNGFYLLEIVTLPTVGVFEVYDGLGNREDDSSWILVDSLENPLEITGMQFPNYRFNSTLNYTYDVDGNITGSTPDTDSDNDGISDNVGKSTDVDWRVKTATYTFDGEGNMTGAIDVSNWSNTETGVVSIQNFDANTEPAITITYPDDSTLEDNPDSAANTVMYDEDGNITDNVSTAAVSSTTTTNSNNTITISEDGQTSTITLEYYDDVAPAEFMQGIMQSSNTDLIDFSDPNCFTINQVVDPTFGTAGKGTITLTLIPKANMYGTATITLGANDGQKSTQETFTLEVVSVNDTPIGSDFTKEVDEDGTFFFSTINPADIYQDPNDVHTDANDESPVDFDTQMGIIQTNMGIYQDSESTADQKNAAMTDIMAATTALVEANYFPQNFVIETLPLHGDLYLGETIIDTPNTSVDIMQLSQLMYKPDADYNTPDGEVDTFTWHAIDKENAVTQTKTATFTINPTNDTPILSVDDSNYSDQESLTETNGKLDVQGLIKLTDIDTADTVDFTTTTKDVNSVQYDENGFVMTTDSLEPSKNDLLDMFSIEREDSLALLSAEKIVDLTWSFDTINETFDYLSKDESVVLTYTITATDNSGVSVEQNNDKVNSTSYDIVITITGTNDDPVITLAEDSSAITESVILNDSGNINFEDLDSTNNPVGTFEIKSITSDVNLTSEQQENIVDSFSISNLEANSNNGTVSWDYTITEGELDFLAEDELVTVIYKITVTDDEGSIDTQDVVITLTGTNDTPIIDSITSTGGLTEVTGYENGTNPEITATGTIQLSDKDDTDTVTLSEEFNDDMVWSAGSITDSQLTQTQIQALIDGFVLDDTNALEIDDVTNTVNSSWTYTTSEDLNFLAKGETLTFSYTVKATDDSADTNTDASITKVVTITLTGTNDTPVVDATTNLDDKTPFGKEYLKEMASYFIDPNTEARLDLTDIPKFVYSAYNLPTGLTIDSQTGTISGGAVQSGTRTITVRATDPHGAYNERTFELLVIAPPPPPEAEAPAEETADEKESVVKKIDVNDGGGEGTDEGFEITKTELTTIVKDDGGNDQGSVISADFTVDVLDNGQVTFGDDSKEVFDTVGLVVENMGIDIETNQIEIEVVDTRVGQKYIATLTDGSDLPSTLSFDPNTGIIKGTLPAGMEELDISVNALSDDGTTRILNIKIDINKLKEQVKEAEANEAKFDTLKDQINAKNHEMNGYGDYVASLFSDSVAV